MADLEAALQARDPKLLPKHSIMMAAAGMAVEDGKLLLVRDHQGFWAGVGGFVDPGETPEEALLREVREELGVEAEITRVFHPALFWHVAGNASFLLFIYGISLASTDLSPDPTEVTEIRWVGHDEWPDLDMLPWVRSVFHRSAADWLAAGAG